MFGACAATIYAILATFVAVAALGSAMGLPPLPEPLAHLDQRLPGTFRLHMAASALGLLLLPVILGVRRQRLAHRTLGRVGALLLLMGAASSLPAALQSEAMPMARAGFFAQGSLSLMFLVGAVKAIRGRDVQRHVHMMLRVAALVSGAVVLRVMMAVAMSLGLPFDGTYAMLARLSWLLPLLGIIIWTHPAMQRPVTAAHSGRAELCRFRQLCELLVSGQVTRRPSAS